MDTLPTPHNNFFQFALSHIPSARSLIESQLTPSALAALNLDTLRLEQGNFVDADLSEKFSDLLFSVQLANDSTSDESADEGRPALVYLLFEHKSQSDSLTVVQLLSYIVRICEKRIRAGLRVCPIVPLVVYHGESGWWAARSMEELLTAPPGLAEYQVKFEFPLLDLSQMSDSEIPGEPILRNVLQLLKYSRSRELLEKLHEILKWIAAMIPKRNLIRLDHGDWVLCCYGEQDDGFSTIQANAQKYSAYTVRSRVARRSSIEARSRGRTTGRSTGRD